MEEVDGEMGDQAADVIRACIRLNDRTTATTGDRP